MKSPRMPVWLLIALVVVIVVVLASITASMDATTEPRKQAAVIVEGRKELAEVVAITQPDGGCNGGMTLTDIQTGQATPLHGFYLEDPCSQQDFLDELERVVRAKVDPIVFAAFQAAVEALFQ